MNELLIPIILEFTQTHTLTHGTSPFYIHSFNLGAEKD